MKEDKIIAIEELCIGSLVGIKYDANKTVYKVVCLMFNHVQVESEAGEIKSVHIDAIDPILLTEEWMMKLEKAQEGDEIDPRFCAVYTYVHRFQNLLRLCD